MNKEELVKSPLRNINNEPLSNLGHKEAKKLSLKNNLLKNTGENNINGVQKSMLQKENELSLSMPKLLPDKSAYDIILKVGSAICMIAKQKTNPNLEKQKAMNDMGSYIESYNCYKKKYSCNHCNFKTPYISLLRKHKERIHKTKFGQPLCAICGETFYGVIDFEGHLESKHNVPIQRNSKNRDIKCKNCSFSAHYAVDLTKHVKNCSYKWLQPIVEDIPQTFFSRQKFNAKSKLSAKPPSKSEKISSKKTVKIEKTSPRSLAETNQVTDVFVQDNENKNIQTCIICCKESDETIKHMHQNHCMILKTMADEEECNSCNASKQSSGSDLKLVLKKQSSCSTKKEPNKLSKSEFKCDSCQIAFKTSATLLKHEKIMHGYSCDLCPANFLNKQTKLKHYKQIHTKLCPICKKEFDTAQKFMKHAKNYIRECSVKLKRLTNDEVDLFLTRDGFKKEKNSDDKKLTGSEKSPEEKLDDDDNISNLTRTSKKDIEKDNLPNLITVEKPYHTMPEKAEMLVSLSKQLVAQDAASKVIVEEKNTDLEAIKVDVESEIKGFQEVPLKHSVRMNSTVCEENSPKAKKGEKRKFVGPDLGPPPKISRLE